MKLHLPTALFALAVLPAVAFAFEVDKDAAGNTLIKLTEASAEEYHKNFAHDSQVDYYTPTNEKNTLILDGDDKVGYFVNDELQVTDDKQMQEAATNILYVRGNVELSGNAKVYANGNNITGYGAPPYYRAGMVAESVSVSGNAVMNLGAAKFESLVIKDNATVIVEAGSDQGAQTGGFWEKAGSYGYCARSMTITNGLEVTGGTLTVGKTPNTSSSNWQNYPYSNNAYLQSVIEGPITQSGGTIRLIASNYIKSDSINQTGGNMTLSEAQTYSGHLRASKLRFEDEVVNIKQSGGTMNLNGIIIRGDSGAEKMQLNIEQSGDGTINMVTGKELTNIVGKANPQTADENLWSTNYVGSKFTTGDGPASTIKQSGSGTININSDYTSATFNVEQTGKGGNITIGVNGRLQSDALTLTDASTFTIKSIVSGDDKKSGSLTLNKGAEVTFAVSSLVSTLSGNTGGLVVEDGGNFTAEGLVSVKVVFSDDVVMAALTELTSAENQVLGSRQNILIATNVGDAITFQTGASSHTESYTLDDGTVATVEFNYVLTHDKGQLVANSVTATVTSIGTTPAIPEPTTTTLSLLALAGLCARRRRK